jgi:hypothetical protein
MTVQFALREPLNGSKYEKIGSADVSFANFLTQENQRCRFSVYFPEYESEKVPVEELPSLAMVPYPFPVDGRFDSYWH